MLVPLGPEGSLAAHVKTVVVCLMLPRLGNVQYSTIFKGSKGQFAVKPSSKPGHEGDSSNFTQVDS